MIFSEDNVLSDEIKICLVNKFERSAFFFGGGGGTPGIVTGEGESEFVNWWRVQVSLIVLYEVKMVESVGWIRIRICLYCDFTR